MADIELTRYKLEIIDQTKGYSRVLEVGAIDTLLSADQGDEPLIIEWLKEVREQTN